MKNLKDRKIGNLVAEDYRYADVFKKYGIDFCCGGGISIEEACKKQQVDYQMLISDLNALEASSSTQLDFNAWPLDKLVDYIVSEHHHYVSENLPLIVAYAQKVAKVHGDKHPEVLQLFALTKDLENELFPHLNKEEIVLFPYVKNMVGEASLRTLPFGSVRNPINSMLQEHDHAGDLMKQIRRLTHDYQPPADACTTFRVLYQKLQDFENDLHQHVHLENNILFPKAIEMEEQLQMS